MVVTRLDRLGRSTIDLLTIVGFRSDLENMIKPFSKCVLEARLLGKLEFAEGFPNRGVPRCVATAFTTSNRGLPEEGRRYRRAQRLRPTALVETGGMVERGRLEALCACMMSGVTVPPWRSRFYLASRKIRNKSIASFRACTRHVRYNPKLLTYRGGAANRRFGPGTEVED